MSRCGAAIVAEIGGQGAGAANRWNGRPFLAGAISLAVFLGPIVAAILVATLVAALLPTPNGTLWLVAWWAVMLVIPSIVLVPCERLARRALPLATLLKMTLLFPDRAPTRLSVARKAGSTHSLERRLIEARASGLEMSPLWRPSTSWRWLRH
jgi:MFS family permease